MAPTSSPSKAPRRTKKKKVFKSKDDLAGQEGPKILTLNFGGNQYIGTVSQDSLGIRSLEAGSATYKWKGGPKYEGPFVASCLQGVGKYTWPDGSSYEGEVQNGKRHGYGTYFSADGVTKYEGQWHQGKRHGTGRLTYDAAGDSFYDGHWQDGLKHGFGRQVWPTKNTYEGQWQYGRMSGHGTMTWCDGGILERYTGNWEDDHPQGEGKHSWHASDPTKFEMGFRDMPSQQMNNSYVGQWDNGVRHGTGTFNYASGANYHGGWVENTKQGQGRYTYEDGNVYCGLFADDNIADPTASRFTSQPATSPNIGADDNPIRRCLDISDLQAYCQASEHGQLKDSSSIESANEVLREVYNILLRSIGDLKKSYMNLRSALKRDSEDPFLLSSYQLWILIRDMGLNSPDRPIGLLNRHVLCGPRRHQEACYEDMVDLRPLTPRQNRHHNRENTRTRSLLHGQVKQPFPRQESRRSEAGLNEEDQDAEVSDYEEDDESDDFEAEAILEAVPVQQGATADVDGLQEDRRRSASKGRPSTRRRRSSAQSEASAGGDDGDQFSASSRLWRETSEELVNVHSPASTFMFRHFLEGLVRLSVACFPEEQELDKMLRKLLDNLLANVGVASLSHSTFDFLVNDDINRVFEAFHHKLWNTFKENATGEGQYGPSLAEAQFTQEGNSLKRCCRRHFGGVHRRAHFRCRMDVTIRVKDMMLILNSAGLLEHSLEKHELVDAFSSIFPNRLKRPTSGTQALADLEGLKAMTALLSVTCESPDDASLHVLEANVEGAHKSLAVTGEDGEQPVPVLDASALESFLKGNFRVSFYRLLELLTEVMNPVTSARICWKVDGHTQPEYTGLLDYMETELTFAEFQRLLLRLAQQQLYGANEKSTRYIAACLEAFLEHVFLPAVTNGPYDPPPTASLEAGNSLLQKSTSNFWHGFSEADETETVAVGAGRTWPQSYQDEVASW